MMDGLSILLKTATGKAGSSPAESADRYEEHMNSGYSSMQRDCCEEMIAAFKSGSAERLQAALEEWHEYAHMGDEE